MIRLINLHLSLISIIYFYKCLLLKFTNTNKNYLILISATLLLSPTFRSLSIWPDSRIYGLHFFIISTFFYLKFIYIEKKIYYCYLNIILLAISSYFSPNFSLFSIFFLYQFYKHFKISGEILTIVYFKFNFSNTCFLLSYLFLMYFFLSSGKVPGHDQC